MRDMTTILSAGLVAGFIGFFFLAPDAFNTAVDEAFNWSARYFGLYWQVLLIANLLVGLALAVRQSGTRVLGGLPLPEFPAFQWIAMVLCTLLAGGGVFWAAAEPLAHFVAPPPLFNEVVPASTNAVPHALAQSFLHWGFLAWSILGSVSAVLLMHLHYERGLPLAPRTLLFPIFGERAIKGWIGDVADISSILAVFAGTVGPIGFLGLQISYGLGALYGTSDNLVTQLMTIAGLMAIYLFSAVSGMHRGIQILSRLNIALGLALLLYVFVVGPTGFVLTSFFEGLRVHLANGLEQALFRGDAGFFGDPGWLSLWTVFFWGWFIGYGPMMAIFIARISRGRSGRSIVILMSIVAPLITMAWFTLIGGTGLGLELADPGVISKPFEGFNLPAALLAITGALPYSEIVSALFLVLTTLFVATTGDSMTYSLAVVSARTDHPPQWLRLFWGFAMGITAMILITGTGGGIGKLQSFIVVTAVPVSFVLLFTVAGAIRWEFAAPTASSKPIDS